MKLTSTILLASAAFTATTTAFPLLTTRHINLDALLGFSSDPQAGFDERTHGKVWVNGKGPGREYAKGYGLVPGSKEKEVDEGWLRWMDKEMSAGREREGSWAAIWEVIVGGAEDDKHLVAIPGHEHGFKYQAVPIGGMRTPHEPHSHPHHDHHDHPHPHHNGPHSHSDVTDEDLETMLVAAGVHPKFGDHPPYKHGRPEPGFGPGRGRGRGGRHHHRLMHGSGERHPRCFVGRFLEALTHLKPHETFLITFTLVLGFLSILKLLVVLVVLVKRSHQYANEVEGGGYPGAEFRNRRERERLPGYEEVANGEEEAEKREKE